MCQTLTNNFHKNAIRILLIFASKFPYQIMDETPELAKGAAKAVFELYHVVNHSLLSSELRYGVGCSYFLQLLFIIVKSGIAYLNKI